MLEANVTQTAVVRRKCDADSSAGFRCGETLSQLGGPLVILYLLII